MTVAGDPELRAPVRWRAFCNAIRLWFDNSRFDAAPSEGGNRVDWVRCIPFIALHLACGFAFVVGVSATAVFVAVALYALRMFAITGFYHRYFSHRSFRTSRPIQFLFAFLGATSVQRGPLWWAGHHRNHHRYSDEPNDVHSPRQHGMLWSHMGWFMSREGFATPKGTVPDLERYPELRFLDRFDILAPAVLAVVLYFGGESLASAYPHLGTSGWQLVVWGFVISTVVLFHATCTINSLSHVFGKRRYETTDDSRNNPWLALITFGEGWHNNHHRYPHSARQGFAWWEFDLTYYGLRALAACRLISDLKPVPETVYPGEARSADREPG